MEFLAPFLGALVLIALAFNFAWAFFAYREKRGRLMPDIILKVLRFWYLFELSFVFLICLSLLLLFWPPPKVISPSDPSLGITAVSRQNPVLVKFDHPVDKKALNYEIQPPLKGEWKVENNLFSRRITLQFSPAETPIADTRYTVSVSGIKNYLNPKVSDYLFSFQTPPLPMVQEVSVKDGDEGVLPSQEIIVSLDSLPDDNSLFYFEMSPSTVLEASKDGARYSIKAKDGFQKSLSYAFKIYRTPCIYNLISGEKISEGEKTEIWSSAFRTIDAPGIATYSPTGSGVLTDSPIVIEFRQDMDRQSAETAFSIDPKVSGTFSWSDRVLTFKPASSLAKNTQYSVIVAKTAKAADQSGFSEDISFQFTTIGYVSVSKFTPANGASAVDKGTAISVTFNQAVDHASAESKFSISPSIAGTFSWSGDTLTFNHNDFDYGTSYTVKIEAPVKSVNGLDSKDQFSATFTTQQQNILLKVPSYKQAHMYSCMITAARNALAYRGINVSEANIIAQVGYDTTAWSGTWSEGGAVWGDPDSGIVGDLDGKANNIGWGYGSHWTPIARAISSLGRATEVKSGWTVSGLAQEIADGNPVIIWWVNGVWPSYEVNWKTPGGKNVRAVNGMHVVVVKGFTGTIADPTAFSVTDSGYGYPGKTYDVGTFKAKWNWFGNTGVIVR